MDEANSLKIELNAKGWRYTPQRDIIIQVFQNLPKGNHLSAEEVHQILTEQGENISLSTVYRNLKVLILTGILREVVLAKSHKHYELKQDVSHHHIVCSQCNHIVEFDNQSILKEGWKQAAKSGAKLLDCQLTLHTVCSEAVRMGWPGSLPNDWVCWRSDSKANTKASINKPLQPNIDIKEKVLCKIELRKNSIIFYIIEDKSNTLKQVLKSIEGWRLSRKDDGWYFPIEKALYVLDFLNHTYKFELVNADIIQAIAMLCE